MPRSVRLAVASSIFLVGGATSAELAAEWLTAALDQNTGMWDASSFGAGMEVVAIDWLKQLFALPPATKLKTIGDTTSRAAVSSLCRFSR
jgi:glutamate/tyrosine decarboxylase-like PLP-dependent enzyme